MDFFSCNDYRATRLAWKEFHNQCDSSGSLDFGGYPLLFFLKLLMPDPLFNTRSVTLNNSWDLLGKVVNFIVIHNFHGYILLFVFYGKICSTDNTSTVLPRKNNSDFFNSSGRSIAPKWIANFCCDLVGKTANTNLVSPISSCLQGLSTICLITLFFLAFWIFEVVF